MRLVKSIVFHDIGSNLWTQDFQKHFYMYKIHKNIYIFFIYFLSLNITSRIQSSDIKKIILFYNNNDNNSVYLNNLTQSFIY